MDNTTRFFSICDKEKWRQGHWEGVDLTDEGILLAKKSGYVFEKFIRLEEHCLGFRFKKLIASQKKELYIMNQKNELWHYSMAADELTYACDMEGIEVGPNAKYCIWSDLIVCLSLDEKRIYFKSISKDALLKTVTYHELEFDPMDMSINDNGLLILINNKGNLQIIDIPKDEKKNINLDLSDETFNQVAVACVDSNKFMVRVDGEVWQGYCFDPEEIKLVMFCEEDEQLHLNEGLISERVVDDFVVMIHHSDFKEEERLKKEIRDTKHFINDNRLIEIEANGVELKIWKLEKQYLVPNVDNSVGVYYSKCFDSNASNTIWNRYSFEGNIPGNTNVEIAYYAFEDDEMIFEGTQIKIKAFLESHEISIYDKELYLADRWVDVALNAKDGLFFDTEGRYIIIKVQLIGMANDSPSIERIRVYYNRDSYLKYLPEVFQQESDSKDFLERLLSIYEVFLSEMEEQIDNMAMLFDPNNLDGEMLSWIADWMKVKTLNSWSDGKARRFIQTAPELYKARGTRRGIENLLEFCTGCKPVIIEHFELNGADKNEIYPDSPYSVTILIRNDRYLMEHEMAEIIDLLTDEVPVYLTLKVVQLQRFTFLDRTTFLGVNSYVSEFNAINLNNENTMAYNKLENDTIENLQTKWVNNLNI